VPRAANPYRETILPLTLLGGDTLVTFAGLSLGYWLRYESPIGQLGIDVPGATYRLYLPLLLVGVALLIASYAQLGLYDARLLLRRYKSLNAILKGAAFWFAIYLGVSLVLKFEPPISRLFVLLGFVCVVLLLGIWRALFYRAVTRSILVTRLRQRVVLVGWNDQAQALTRAVTDDSAHPFQLVGIVSLERDTAPPFASKAAGLPLLGSVEQLDTILAGVAADLVVLTRLDLPRPEIQRVVEICERAYVEWKIAPGAFDIFLSGLHLQTIGRVPLLGVEELAVRRLFNRALKRSFDLVGAVVGLVLSAPFVGVLAILIRRESPAGPVFFGQTRVGVGHRPFTLWKLRSMRPDAPKFDDARQSTARNDARVLRIGMFMRRWNLDELPQFWNVLRGEMSLVGPRPERPFHVERLSAEIPHYLPRHLAKPGMTGWAQVNGLRGESDLAARVQHDIYYIENWSIWLDVQIVLLTFVRWKNTY
jgi:exopolysaccharide biosynthesis polyprenyl glycosylphosphotransferase